MSTTKPTSERDVLRTQLTRMGNEFKMALPSHIPPERFIRVVLTAVQHEPELMYADRRSLLMSATKCAADGLLPDGREAALVIFNTKAKDDKGKEVWLKAVQYLPMVAGILKRVHQGGIISSLTGDVIYENDHFVWKQGTAPSLEHEPLFPGDRGKPIGAYAVAQLKDGGPAVFRVMDVAAIEKRRQASRAKNGLMWRDWWEEGAIKTVIRYMGKYLPAASEIDRLTARDDEVPQIGESTETIDAVLTEDQRAVAPPSKLDALEGPTIENDPENQIGGDLVFPGQDKVMAG